MKKIVITGTKGTIGTVLSKGLRDYEILPIDLPKVDVRNYSQLSKAIKGSDTIIHLAWSTRKENLNSDSVDTDNTAMFQNIYRAALEYKVKRVIMASSVHADTFSNMNNRRLLRIDRDPQPDSPYGAHKIFMEKLGSWYATKGLEVICIRFGGVFPLNAAYDGDLPITGLSHPDCIELIKMCLEAKTIPNNYVILYGISENTKRIHDYSNPFGWKPKTNAEDFYKKN